MKDIERLAELLLGGKTGKDSEDYAIRLKDITYEQVRISEMDNENIPRAVPV